MANIYINSEKVIAKIKPMNCVNNFPSMGNAYNNQFQNLKIPYSRLHDTACLNPHLVDVDLIFPNFDADENDENSYDFAFTDFFIKRLIDLGTKPFYRLGSTIETFHFIKAYHINPPKDYLKWAKICEHIIAHYNEGWANGFNYDIEYWEIWNEPEQFVDIEKNQMWKGTYDEFLRFYEVTSNYLKNRFPNIKIGGHGCCGFYALMVDVSPLTAKQANTSPEFYYFIECFNKFIDYVTSKEHKSPLDFLSWHSYMWAEGNERGSYYVRKILDEHGLYNTENILNEWNPSVNERGTLYAAAKVMTNMIMLQNSPLDMLMYYDARVNTNYGGIFNPVTASKADDEKQVFPPYKPYYTFLAFRELKEKENQVECEVRNDKDIHILAAIKDGEGVFVMVNDSTKRKTVNINGVKVKSLSLLSKTKDLTEIIAKNKITLNAYEVVLGTF